MANQIHEELEKWLTISNLLFCNLQGGIVSTDLRPDIAWWNDNDQSVCLVELTVCYDTLFQEAALKRNKISGPPLCYLQSRVQGRLDHN